MRSAETVAHSSNHFAYLVFVEVCLTDESPPLAQAANSTRNIGFDVTSELGHFARLAMTCDALFGSADEGIEFNFRYTVFLKSIIIGMNGDRPQRNNLVAVQDPDVFTFCRSFQ